MNISTKQYLDGLTGKFMSREIPEPGDKLTLVMPTCRGRRHLPVGEVESVMKIGSGQCLVMVKELAKVEGMNY